MKTKSQLSLLPAILIIVTMVMMEVPMATGRRLEEEKPPLSKQARSWVVVTLFGFIISMSILFELGRDALYSHFRDSGKHEYTKIIDAMFKELTILGFVGLCLMCMIKAGIMTNIAHLFAYTHPHPDEGEEFHGSSEPTEEIDLAFSRRLHADPMAEHLTEIFEEIHILIFVIMICFISLVTILLITAQLTQKKFQSSEHITEMESKKSINFLDRISHVDHLLYRIIRHEFYQPSDSAGYRGVKPASFDFAEYLGLCMVEFVVELIEIPVTSFIILLFLLLCIRKLLLTPEDKLVYLYTAGSWVLFILLVIILIKLHEIFFSCLPESCPTYTSAVPLRGSQVVGPTRPRFYNDKLRRCDNPITKLFLGTSSPTKQEARFWFWSNGPRFIVISVQLLLFAQAVFLAVFFRSGATNIWDAPIYLTILQWLPFFIGLAFVWPRILFFYTISTSTNLMKSMECIDEIAHTIAKRQFRRYESLILELNTNAQVHMIKSLSAQMYTNWRCIQLNKFETTVSGEQAVEIDAAFDMWDTDKSGFIDQNEMLACLKGQHTSEDRIRRIMDCWFHESVFRHKPRKSARPRTLRMTFFELPPADSQLVLSKEDFRILMVNLIELEEGRCDDENTDMWIKEVLDGDESGTVSVDEFYDVLSDVCKASALDKDGLRQLFAIINGTDDDVVSESVEVTKLVVWLKHFSETGVKERQERPKSRAANVKEHSSKDARRSEVQRAQTMKEDAVSAKV